MNLNLIGIQFDIWNNISLVYKKDLMVAQIFYENKLIAYRDSWGNDWNIRDYGINNPFSTYVIDIWYNWEKFSNIGNGMYSSEDNVYIITSTYFISITEMDTGYMWVPYVPAMDNTPITQDIE